MITLISNGHPLHEISCKTLAGYLEYFSIQTKVIYLNNCDKLNSKLVNRVLDISKSSKLIGFSLMSKDLEVLLPLIRKIKLNLSIPIVFGGIHPSVMPRESLKESDYVCVSEGEEPLRMLYEFVVNKSHDLKEIPNIGYINAAGEYIQNSKSFSVKSLDVLPYPDYKFEDSYFLTSYLEGKQLVKIPSDSAAKHNLFKVNSFMFYSQRGCKLACTYCSNSFYHHISKETGVKWLRFASADRVKNELKSHLKNLPFVKHIGINDDDFLARDINSIKEITEFLKYELKVTFNVNAIPKYVTKESLDIMAKNGLKQIALGVQSGSDRILKNVYRRPVSSASIREAAKLIENYYSYGVSADYGFILDNPYEDVEDIRDSLRLMISLPQPFHLSLYSLAFFPGTTLTAKALMEKKIKDQHRDLKKKYHDSIRPTYGYFIFLINSKYRIPNWLNELLLTDIMYKSRLFSPLRLVLGWTTLVLRIKLFLKKASKFIFLAFIKR